MNSVSGWRLTNHAPFSIVQGWMHDEFYDKMRSKLYKMFSCEYLNFEWVIILKEWRSKKLVIRKNNYDRHFLNKDIDVHEGVP